MKQYDIKSALVAGLVATTAMTIFSYAISKKKRKNFKEPELLAELTQRILPAMDKKAATAAGFILHYGVGEVFALSQNAGLEKFRQAPTVANGLLYGFAGGIAGISIWKATFELHPAPPQLSYRRFFGHLLLAHLVFGLTLSTVLRKMRSS